MPYYLPIVWRRIIASLFSVTAHEYIDANLIIILLIASFSHQLSLLSDTGVWVRANLLRSAECSSQSYQAVVLMVSAYLLISSSSRFISKLLAPFLVRRIQVISPTPSCSTVSFLYSLSRSKRFFLLLSLCGLSEQRSLLDKKFIFSC